MLAASAAGAESYRFLTYNAELTRKGPGLLVRDLMRFEDAALIETLQRIVELKPDVAALQSFDFDHNHVALQLVQDRLAELGHAMPYRFALMPNAGQSTGFDLNRDGRLDTASDRQGYGQFLGQGGVAILSRHPIETQAAKDLSSLLWKDLPDAHLPKDYFTAQELDVLRLHGVAAWDVPVHLPGGTVHVLAVQASSPVFDGPENRNGLRNADQLRFWDDYVSEMEQPFVLMGGLNNDPFDGEGLSPPLRSLLGNAALQDTRPRSAPRDEQDPLHLGPTLEDTVDWGREIGSLRVDYILPSAGLGVVASGVDWGDDAQNHEDAPAHRPVWVDLTVP